MLFNDLRDPIHGRTVYLGINAQTAGEEVFLKALVEAYHGQSVVTVTRMVPDDKGRIMQTQTNYYSPSLLQSIEASKNMEEGYGEGS